MDSIGDTEMKNQSENRKNVDRPQKDISDREYGVAPNRTIPVFERCDRKHDVEPRNPPGRSVRGRASDPHPHPPEVDNDVSTNGKAEEHELIEKNNRVGAETDGVGAVDVHLCDPEMCMKMRERYDTRSGGQKPWNKMKTKICFCLLSLLMVWLMIFSIWFPGSDSG